MAKLKNYLSKDRVHYSIFLKDGKIRSVQLKEHIDGLNKHFSNNIGVIYSWRAEIIQKFLNNLIKKYHDDLKNRVKSYQTVFDNGDFTMDFEKTKWNNEYKLNTEVSMKLLLAIRLTSSIEQRPRVEEALEIIHSMSDEEVSFWAWKILSLKSRALNGFKAMYL